jgi:hypothetical protein
MKASHSFSTGLSPRYLCFSTEVDRVYRPGYPGYSYPSQREQFCVSPRAGDGGAGSIEQEGRASTVEGATEAVLALPAPG